MKIVKNPLERLKFPTFPPHPNVPIVDYFHHQAENVGVLRRSQNISDGFDIFLCKKMTFLEWNDSLNMIRNWRYNFMISDGAGNVDDDQTTIRPGW